MSGALKDPGVDGALLILTPQSMTDIEAIAEEVCRISSQHEKPLYASFMGEADVAVGVDLLQRARIPHYQLPENMCRAFACSHRFKTWCEGRDAEPVSFPDIDRAGANRILDQALASGKSYLPEFEAVEVLEAYGLPVLPHGLAGSMEEAVAMAETIRYPVVMKVMSEQIVHKFDVGGVVLNIGSRDEAEAAYREILTRAEEAVSGAEIAGVFVQKMVEGGEETILGLKRDPSFGPVVMFGLGGLFVEVFKDVSFRVAPLGREDAWNLIMETRSHPLLIGARGRPERDLEALQDCILRLSALALDCPQIRELDINPLIVLNKEKGCCLADSKIMLVKGEKNENHHPRK